MDEELKEKLLKIITELPDENSWLDYKQIPYQDSEKAEFIRDLCAFLNCKESYGKDKFIIFGITDKTKKRIGLIAKPMQDDSFYQDLARKIEPFPIIETGRIKTKIDNQELEFGYICISKKNNNRIYTIKETYPQLIGNRTTLIKDTVFASTAFIRRGSIKKPLSEIERREIYEEDKKLKNEYIPNYQNFMRNINEVTENNKIIKAAIIFGGWDETNDADKQLLSDYIGMPYNNLIENLRVLLKEENTMFSFNNNKWNIKDKFERLKEYANTYFRDDVVKFQEKAIEVLSERNPKFDLSSDKRQMYSIYGKTTKYSYTLRKNISESLPMIKSIYNNFINCSNEIYNVPLLIVRNVLKNTNWEIWASLNELLPLLAEAAPEEFLDQVETKIDSKTIEKLFSENEYGITVSNYSAGLYEALDLIAWETRNLILCCMIYSRLAKYDETAIEKIAYIILPWFPQTKAPIENRKIVVNNILKENVDIGWKLLLKILPGGIDSALSNIKPKWNNIIDKEQGCLNSEYVEQINAYIELAIEYVGTDCNRICDLIELLGKLPKEMFTKIYNKLSNKKIIELNEEKKYIVWNCLEDLIVRHTKFKDSDWALSKERLDELKILSDKLRPKKIEVYTRRFFRRDTWNIIDDRNDYKLAEENLYKKQLDIIEELYDGDIEKIINYSKKVEDSYLVGVCLAEILKVYSSETDEKILKCLGRKSEKIIDFGRGFTWKRFSIMGNKWLNELKIKEWSKKQKLNFLLVLPQNKLTFDLVINVLGKEEWLYWKEIKVIHTLEEKDVDYVINKLLEVQRAEMVINLVGSKLCIDEEFDFNEELIVKALIELLDYSIEFNSLISYNIRRIISKLQKSKKVSKDKLLKIEWYYLPFLNGEECNPITLENAIASDPEIYNELLSMIYKPHSKEENDIKVNKEIIHNVWNFFEKWKTPPGLENGIINKEKLKIWYDKMRDICSKSDRLEVGLSNFGKVLFYSPKDKDGFWIDKGVAEILNRDDSEIIRRGFSVEAFNSLGVINYDPDGSVFDNLAEKYESEAEEADKEGFFRLARTMRELADSYRNEAEQTRKHYFD